MKKIINKILRLFRAPSVSDLAEESASIIDVFTSTANNLLKVNEEIIAQVDKKGQEILKLQGQLATLSTMKAKNSTVIGKIEALVSE